MDTSETLTCHSCSIVILAEAFFCYNCGTQIKCKSCEEKLMARAHNCISCGTPVLGLNQNNYINTLKLRESKGERVFEIEFTNEVGKEIKEVIADLLKNKGSLLDHPEENIKPFVAIEQTKKAESELQLATESHLAPISLQKPETATVELINDYPHLNDLEIKLDCKENEWLLLFAFYNSNYGASTFTKDVVWQLYKDKRKTETRFKNLGTNWKALFKKHIATVKENEFRFTTAGLQKVKSLLQANGNNTKNNRASNKGNTMVSTRANAIRTMPVSRKVVANSIVPDEFDVYQNSYKEALETFFKRKNPGNGNPNRIVTIAYYITKINHQEYFTEGNIDYAYRILNLTGKPAHLKQVIINLKNERIWFQKIIDQSISGWKLTRQAEIYVEEKLPPRS